MCYCIYHFSDTVILNPKERNQFPRKTATADPFKSKTFKDVKEIIL